MWAEAVYGSKGEAEGEVEGEGESGGDLSLNRQPIHLGLRDQ